MPRDKLALYKRMKRTFDKAKKASEEAEAKVLIIANRIYTKTGICPTCATWDDYNERCPTCEGGRR